MQLVTPFVYRKYLDFDAYAGLRDVHRQIREQGRRKDHAENLKLGPGGIREIEFIVQALQLVRGGRESALRERGTLPALAALGSLGLLPAPAIDELRAAYVFLRNLEHRLQYRDDTQTQDLPSDRRERDALARACRIRRARPRSTAPCACTAAQSCSISMRCSAAPAVDPADPLASLWLDPKPDAAHVAAFAAAGYAEPEALIGGLARVKASARYLQLPALSRERFDALVPQLLRVAAHHRAAESGIRAPACPARDDQRAQRVSRASCRASSGAAAHRRS